MNAFGPKANNGNYTFVQAPANTTTLTINPAPLTAVSATASGSGASAYVCTGLSRLAINVSGGNALAVNYSLPSSADMAITTRPIMLKA